MSSAIEAGRIRALSGLRRVAVVAAVVAVGWLGFGLWRTWSLAGLPDVGDPFDVPEFERSRQVAPAEDAAPLYVQASGSQTIVWFGPGRDLNFQRWEDAAEAKRGDLTNERAALDLWRKGAETPRCTVPGLPHVFHFWHFSELAALEASRLEAEGDVAGAWPWYRAILRSMEHVARGMEPHDRRRQLRLRAAVTGPILHWAADDRVDAKSLRAALADLVSIDEASAPEIEIYRDSYLSLMRSVGAGSNSPTNYVGPMVPFVGTLPPATNRAWMPMRSEPERSRRVLRLIFANWLAWASRPRAERPGPIPAKEGDPILYPVPPDAPAAARALPPDALIRWYRSSSFARFLYLGHDGENLCEYVIVRERAARARLIVAIAEQLYRREHGGQSPPDRSALVGPYLKTLPEGVEP